jgi:circadian clock protein KaiC
MSEDPTGSSSPPRIATGIRGLDRVLGGGLFRGGIYVVSGHPGAGKTTFANQVSFRFAADGGRASYVTLLSETHARMLFQVQGMSFFQAPAVGSSLLYLDGFSAIASEGLDGLLKMVRQCVRDQRAGLLVLDGMVTAGTLAPSGIDYKKFINELQTWVGVVGCTVLFLASLGEEDIAQPEYSMVDGIFELESVRTGLRSSRQITVSKFRGSAFSEGAHPYAISGDGIVVYPRLETWERPAPRPSAPGRASLGDPAFDAALGGGLLRGSSTLLVGPTGSGKTTAGLQFLGAGLADGEPGLFCGFVEPAAEIAQRGDGLGLSFGTALRKEALHLMSGPPGEIAPDRLGQELLEVAERRGVRRVFIDGAFGLAGPSGAERLPGFLHALAGQLSGCGVTTLISDDSRELLGADGEMLLPGLARFADNVIMLQDLSTGLENDRLLTVLKTRHSAHHAQAHQYRLDGTGFRVQLPAPVEGPALGLPELPPPPRPAGKKRRRK